MSLLLLLGGCVYRSDHGVEARTTRAMAGVEVPSGTPRRLVYDVDGDGGIWQHEVVVWSGGLAERRTQDTGASYAFGVDDAGAWLRVQDRPVVVVDIGWEGQARREASLHGLRFARPRADDHRETLGRYPTGWDIGFRAADADSMVLSVDQIEALPFAVDTFDPWARVETCADLEWARSADGMVLRRARCGTSNGGDRTHATRFSVTRRLTEQEALDEPPAWARPDARKAPPPRPRSRAFAIDDPTRIEIPVRLGDGPEVALVLDTGAFHTVINEEVARRSGVVPTGEAPLFADGPWVGRAVDWIGVVDRLEIGGLTLHGLRVLVTDLPTIPTGLLGRDALRRVVLDLDSPRGEVTFWGRDAFTPDDRMDRLRLRRGRARVGVDGVVTGDMLLDSGAPLNVVVHDYRMALAHPRRRGQDAFLSAQDSTHSPDYHTHIRGLTLGRFHLPRMEAIGRDRERDALGGGVGIVGMGVMRHFRLAFDVSGGWLHVAPGDSYRLLQRAGLEIADGPLGPTVDGVVRGSPAEQAGLRVGDLVIAIDGVGDDEVRAMRRRLADHREAYARLVISRDGYQRDVGLTLSARPR
ncbi:MAG: aspartyl protease family protein [Polyangiaceae bacterium]